MTNEILELKNIKKVFPGVIALDNLSMTIKKGEIHGLIGENGAGKSVLIKIITGVYKPDAGYIIIEDKETSFNNPIEALTKGISCVYQELNIVPQLSVVDNIFIGRMLKKGLFLDYSLMKSKAETLLKHLGADDIDVNTECQKLGLGKQQLVEIAKALSMNTRILILDEPTSSLGRDESNHLMDILLKLKNEGISILFVSHKIDELFRICDRVTVIRDGKHIFTDTIENITKEKLITSMVGRSLTQFYPKKEFPKGDVFFEAKDLNRLGIIKNISFKAYAGQITGFAGLVGAGRTETMRTIFGADKLDSGEVLIKGEKTSIKKPRMGVKAKIAFLTEDRKQQGLVLLLSTETNLIMSKFESFSNGPFLDMNKIEKTGAKNIDELQIKIKNKEVPPIKLSGGNQQKVVLAKWINTDADIYIFDEPTRGIDIGSKIEIYKAMNDLLEKGKCLIMVSSDMPEILGMSDKVVVMRNGRLVTEVERKDKNFNSEYIMKACFGEI